MIAMIKLKKCIMQPVSWAVFVIGIGVLAATAPSRAQVAKPVQLEDFSRPLSPPLPSLALPSLGDLNRADTARIETYLNSLRTLSGEFLQVGPDGSLAEGRIWLSRPGRLRFEYAPPTPILVVADGTSLIFHDKELGQVDRVPLGFAPLGVLTDDEVHLEGDLEVLAIERAGGLLRITLVDEDRPKEGSVTLVFGQSPLNLRQWQVRDARGLITTVTLRNVETNQPVNPSLFVFER
jgi:outer membrane lipoprotein-sorting protein